MSGDVVKLLGPYTVEDWLADGRPSDGSKRELILGYIRVSRSDDAVDEAGRDDLLPGGVGADRMVRLPSGEHQHAVDVLCELIKSASRWAQRDNHLWPITGVGIEFRRPSPIVVVPDLVILRTRPIGDVFTPDQVALVAEVWSPEDSAEDRLRRFDLYGQAKIQYFWTVDLDGPVIETYEYVDDDSYQRRDTMRGQQIHEVTTAPIPVMTQAALLAPRVSA